jgi:tetratricopeptide (TPR) repeat protein
MSYQILPTLIFVLAIFAAILMVLRRLPEASSELDKQDEKKSVQRKLAEKGLPQEKVSKIKHYGVFWAKRAWRFILEAKEMAPTGLAVLKVKRLFAAKPKMAQATLAEETSQEEALVLGEHDYLDLIKKEPKNYDYYDGLGKLYLEQGNLSDARDVYSYLTSHASGIADYWARLGFVAFKLKNFRLSAEAYKKSVSLDSGQPNRYYNLAQSYKALGEVQEARKALNLAMQMNPENPKFLEFQKRLR